MGDDKIIDCTNALRNDKIWSSWRLITLLCSESKSRKQETWHYSIKVESWLNQINGVHFKSSCLSLVPYYVNGPLDYRWNGSEYNQCWCTDESPEPRERVRVQNCLVWSHKWTKIFSICPNTCRRHDKLTSMELNWCDALQRKRHGQKNCFSIRLRR